MNLSSIKTKKDYEQALARLEVIFDAKKDTSEGDELQIRANLIAQYENEYFPIGLPEPTEAIEFRKEQLGRE